MSGEVSRQYTLLAGSSSLALWGMLARFKTRFVGDVAKQFHDSPELKKKKAALEVAVGILRHARKEFFSTRLKYRAHLTNGIYDLTHIPGVDLSNVEFTAVSDKRFSQINQYFKRVLRQWENVEPTSSVAELFKTLSDSLWPYYAVAYKLDRPTIDPTHSGYNLATWTQNSDILREPYLSRINIDPADKSLFLYPSLVTDDPHVAGSDGCLLGNDSDLIRINDKAGNAFLDFDRQENVAGAVQKITKDELALKFKIWRPVTDTIGHSVPKDETSEYTDFFSFINQVARCILTGHDIDPNSLDVPRGVLFLAGPSIDAICTLINVDESQVSNESGTKRTEELLRRQMIGAWTSSGGASFTSALCKHLDRVREEIMLDLVSADVGLKTLRNRIRQESAWAHDVKHWADPILGDLHFARQHIAPHSPAFQPIRRARLHTQILNAITNARQASLAMQASGDSYFLLPRVKREHACELVCTVMQFLLNHHADTPRNPAQQFELRWPNVMSSDEALQRLADIVPTANEHADLDSIIMEPPVLWSIAFLREVVHNIRLNNAIISNETQHRAIEIEFQAELQNNDLHLRFLQRSYEMQQRPSNDLPEGLVMANELYGVTGIGEIDSNLILEQEPIEIADARGHRITAYRVMYGLHVKLKFQMET